MRVAQNRFVRQLAGFASVLILLLSLSSCGFHLRGSVDMPQWLQAITVINQGGASALPQIITQQLRAYPIEICPTPEKQCYQLIVISDSFQQQISSVSSSTTPRQYQLIYALHFTLLTPEGREVIKPSTISIVRLITMNNDRILGSNYEEDQFKQEMRQDAVLRLLNRISHAEPANAYSKP